MLKPVLLYLGCLIPNRYPGIEAATCKVLKNLGVEFTYLPRASCCPPGQFRSISEEAWLTIAAMNLSLAEHQGEILTLCNGCFGTLNSVNRILANDDKKREIVNSYLGKIGKRFDGPVVVRHIAEFLYTTIGCDRISRSAVRDLDLRVALHYGCHLTHPLKAGEINGLTEPTFFDELVKAIGIKILDYKDKLTCCGAGGGLRLNLRDVSLKMTKNKIERVMEVGADCIVNTCPYCHHQFVQGQKEVGDLNFPVLYYTQLLALIQGVSPQSIGLEHYATQNPAFYRKITALTSYEMWLRQNEFNKPPSYASFVRPSH